eukprot:1389476-Amorphochlora_amoeboformis.AAC.2
MSEDIPKCPICCEDLDLTDRSFKPCKCGYQVCLWCYKDINEKLNGRCPACRTPYKDQAPAKAPDPAQIQREIRKSQAAKAKKKEKRRGASGQVAGATTDRKQMATMRVLQRNLVYVVGLNVRVAKEEILRKKQYFGKYGKLQKIVVNKKVLGNGTTSYCAYVTFKNAKDAELAIKKINGSIIEGSRVKATYGTTKYCTNFLKGATCTNPTCLYLHHLAKAEDCFSKEELSNVDTFNYQELLELSRQASASNTVPGKSFAPVSAATAKRVQEAFTIPSAKLPELVSRRTVTGIQTSERRKLEPVWDGSHRLKQVETKNTQDTTTKASRGISPKARGPPYNSSQASGTATPNLSPPSKVRSTSSPISASSSSLSSRSNKPAKPPSFDVSVGEYPSEPPGLSSFLQSLGSSPRPAGSGAVSSSSLFQQPLGGGGERKVERDVWKGEGWGRSNGSKPPEETKKAELAQAPAVATQRQAKEKGEPTKKWDFNKFVRQVLPSGGEGFMPGFGGMKINVSKTHTQDGIHRQRLPGAVQDIHSWIPRDLRHPELRLLQVWVEKVNRFLDFYGKYSSNIIPPLGSQGFTPSFGIPRSDFSPGQKKPTEALVKDLRALLPGVKISYGKEDIKQSEPTHTQDYQGSSHPHRGMYTHYIC